MYDAVDRLSYCPAWSEWMGQSILSSREADEHNSHSSPTARCDEVSGGLVSRPLGLMMTAVGRLKARLAFLYHGGGLTHNYVHLTNRRDHLKLGSP